MIQEGKAKKIGLHFSRNPRFSQQQSDVIVQSGEYTFHIPPNKEDFQTLPHLGKLSDQVRNPKSKMSLKEAKDTLQRYTGLKELKDPYNTNRTYQKPVFKPLGDSY